MIEQRRVGCGEWGVEGAMEAVSKQGSGSWVEVLVLVERARHMTVAVQRMNESLYSSAMENPIVAKHDRWYSIPHGECCAVVDSRDLRQGS